MELICMLLVMAAILFFVDRWMRGKVQAACAAGMSGEIPAKNTKFLLWAAINFLLLPVTGLIGLVYALKIKRATDHKQREFYCGMAKYWCIGGTLIGILGVLSMML